MLTAALLMLVGLTAGCASQADEAASVTDSAAPAPTPDSDSSSGGDSGDDASPSDPDSGASGECTEAPAENVAGDYPAANLPAVEQRTADLVGFFEASDGRYCIDAAGDITYFLVYDFAEDGFHTLDVCGSVFTYFEGDFEGAAVVYTDTTVRCG